MKGNDMQVGEWTIKLTILLNNKIGLFI